MEIKGNFNKDIPVLEYPFINRLTDNMWQMCFVDAEHKKKCIELLAKKYPEIYEKHRVQLNLYPNAKVINYLASTLPKNDLEALMICHKETLPPKFHHMPNLSKSESVSDLTPREASTYFGDLTPVQRSSYNKPIFGAEGYHKPDGPARLLRRMYDNCFMANSGENKASFLKRCQKTLGNQGLIEYYDLVSESSSWKLVGKTASKQELKYFGLPETIASAAGETKSDFLLRSQREIGRKILQRDYQLDHRGSQLSLVKTKDFIASDLAVSKRDLYASREICDDRTNIALNMKQIQDDPRSVLPSHLRQNLPNPNIWYSAVSGIKRGLDNLANRSSNQGAANALTVAGEAVQFLGYDALTPLSYPSFFVPLATLDKDLKQAGQIMNTGTSREANKTATQLLFYGSLIAYGAGRGMAARSIPTDLRGASLVDAVARARKMVGKAKQVVDRTAGRIREGAKIVKEQLDQTIFPPPSAEAVLSSGERVSVALPPREGERSILKNEGRESPGAKSKPVSELIFNERLLSDPVKITMARGFNSIIKDLSSRGKNVHETKEFQFLRQVMEKNLAEEGALNNARHIFSVMDGMEKAFNILDLPVEDRVRLTTCVLLHDPPNKPFAGVPFLNHNKTAAARALKILEESPASRDTKLKSLVHNMVLNHQEAPSNFMSFAHTNHLLGQVLSMGELTPQQQSAVKFILKNVMEKGEFTPETWQQIKSADFTSEQIRELGIIDGIAKKIAQPWDAPHKSPTKRYPSHHIDFSPEEQKLLRSIHVEGEDHYAWYVLDPKDPHYKESLLLIFADGYGNYTQIEGLRKMMPFNLQRGLRGAYNCIQGDIPGSSYTWWKKHLSQSPFGKELLEVAAKEHELTERAFEMAVTDMEQKTKCGFDPSKPLQGSSEEKMFLQYYNEGLRLEDQMTQITDENWLKIKESYQKKYIKELCDQMEQWSTQWIK